jgi:hypothetical protein
MPVTRLIAEALGYRDRCLSLDAEDRHITISMFKGSKRLEQAYAEGWEAASDYVDYHWRRGAELAEARLLRVAGRLN